MGRSAIVRRQGARDLYRGKYFFPLLLQNVHRYFLYIAFLFPIFLARDVWNALWFTDPTTCRASFGIGVGTLVLTVNVVMLSSFTFGCHSLRHIVGGYLVRLAQRPVRRTMRMRPAGNDESILHWNACARCST